MPCKNHSSIHPSFDTSHWGADRSALHSRSCARPRSLSLEFDIQNRTIIREAFAEGRPSPKLAFMPTKDPSLGVGLREVSSHWPDSELDPTEFR